MAFIIYVCVCTYKFIEKYQGYQFYFNWCSVLIGMINFGFETSQRSIPRWGTTPTPHTHTYKYTIQNINLIYMILIQI
jgi:hypothetical protein